MLLCPARLIRGAIAVCISAIIFMPAAHAAAPRGSNPDTAVAFQAATLTGMTQEEFESRLLYRINRERIKRGLVMVRLRDCAESYAEPWSQFLARFDKFEHQSMQLFAYGCNYMAVGEIIALADATPYQTVQLWMASSGHRAAILTPCYRLVGVASRLEDNGQRVSVVDFGQR